MVFLFSVILQNYLRREKERERASTCCFTLQMLALAVAGTSNLIWVFHQVLGPPLLESSVPPPSPPPPRSLLAENWRPKEAQQEHGEAVIWLSQWAASLLGQKSVLLKDFQVWNKCWLWFDAFQCKNYYILSSIFMCWRNFLKQILLKIPFMFMDW